LRRVLLFVLLSFSFATYQLNQRLAESSATSAATTVAIIGANVIAGDGSEPQIKTIIIKGDRIEAAAAGVSPPAGARIINAKGLTAVPGLFDLHTHLPYASGGGVAGDWPKNLKAYLYCGVTSVVDFGTYPETFEPMRRLVETGVVEAPRLSLAARVTTPGGHGAEGGRGDFFSLEVSTASEARAAVRSVIKYRPDVIKAFTDGWRYGAAPDMTSMNQETLSALVDEAHKNGLKVLTHTVTLEKAKIASRAGVDVIAHGIGNARIDEEIIDLMKSKKTTYAPTLAVYEPRGRAILTPLLKTVLEPAVLERIEPPLTPPTDAEPSGASPGGPRAERWQILQQNTALLRQAGVAFGVGTDAGVTGTHHGWATLRELQLLVSGGLSPLEAITAATGAAARALGVDRDRGSIAPGKLADLILVEGAPHQSIGDIERIKHLFLGGREIDRAKLARDIASPSPSVIPSVKARELIDDFEGVDDRSRLDTLWVNTTEAGVSPSRMVFGRILRDEKNHALAVSSKFAGLERPYVRINVPLSRGAIEPVDAGGFRGVSFDVRGEGDYRLLIPTQGARDNVSFAAAFEASTRWRNIEIPFTSLRRERALYTVAWTGADLLMLSFEIARPPRAIGWLELDNVRFYK
jgi:imidazolonepropionase-like amidohydrolase